MDQGESGGTGMLFFCFFLLFVSGLSWSSCSGGHPTSGKGGGRRDGGHSVTLFLYIDLYFVLLFLSFANPVVYL